jgi:hypothetical protein
MPDVKVVGHIKSAFRSRDIEHMLDAGMIVAALGDVKESRRNPHATGKHRRKSHTAAT